MSLKLLMVLTTLMVAGIGTDPNYVRSGVDVDSPTKQVHVTMGKPAGEHEIELIVADFDEYQLRYYIYPDWQAGWTTDDEGKKIPMQYRVGAVLRVDKQTGTIEAADPRTGEAIESSSVDCFPNNCGGGCCVVVMAAMTRLTQATGPSSEPDTRNASQADPGVMASRACVICVCCSGSAGCRVILDTCNTSNPGDR